MARLSWFEWWSKVEYDYICSIKLLTLCQRVVLNLSILSLHCKKRLAIFYVPSRVVANQTLPCRELLNYSLPGRVWLLTSRLGTGKKITLFYSVVYNTIPFSYESNLWQVQNIPVAACSRGALERPPILIYMCFYSRQTFNLNSKMDEAL